MLIEASFILDAGHIECFSAGSIISHNYLYIILSTPVVD